MEIKLTWNQIEYSDFWFQKLWQPLWNILVSYQIPWTKEHKIIHKLYDIVFITIAAVICGAKAGMILRTMGKLTNNGLPFSGTTGGLPSTIHTTVCFFFFSLFDPGLCSSVFVGWVQALPYKWRASSEYWWQTATPQRRAGGKSIIHMVSAWAMPIIWC